MENKIIIDGKEWEEIHEIEYVEIDDELSGRFGNRFYKLVEKEKPKFPKSFVNEYLQTTITVNKGSFRFAYKDTGYDFDLNNVLEAVEYWKKHSGAEK